MSRSIARAASPSSGPSGCVERPLAWLAGEIDPLLADSAAMQPRDPEALTDLEIERLRTRGPELHALCRELDAYGAPACLEHGDFWAANVIATERGSVLIDWEDATLSHPFLSAYLAVDEPRLCRRDRGQGGGP